jgi:virulence factor Mce-like protein
VIANPVLIGSVTTLVVVVAVLLAYNANNGLPFVPTRLLNVQLPNGQELNKGDDVRSGGTLVGIVSGLRPARLPSGQVGAIATLRLGRSIGSVPADSTVTIRARSTLGLKYVDLTRGNATTSMADGGTLPEAQARTQVDLDQVYDIFDRPTRTATQTNLAEFSNALAGRGADLNATIQELPTTLKALTPVAHNLADPTTRLDNFFKQIEITAGTLAPVAGVQARLFTSMANTWAAVSRDPQALHATIAKSPPTLDVATGSLRVQTPFLRETAAFSNDLNSATAQLRAALPTLNSALRVAVPVTQRSVIAGIYPELRDTMGALRDLTQAPTTNAALRGLTATVTTLQPQLRFLGPYVTVCNYWNAFWTYTAEHFSEPIPTGTSQRVLLSMAPGQPDGLNVQGAANSVAGQGPVINDYPPDAQPPGGRVVPAFLHGAPNGAAVTNNGLADCETGQRGYIHKGNQFGSALIEVDAHTPLGYRHGPTFRQEINGVGVGRGPDQVPAGETFTREPGAIGEQAP